MILYYLDTVCQGYDKSYGCCELQGKKFSAATAVCEKFLSSLDRARYEVLSQNPYALNRRMWCLAGSGQLSVDALIGNVGSTQEIVRIPDQLGDCGRDLHVSRNQPYR